MSVGDVLSTCAEAGLTLVAGETNDELRVSPVEKLEGRPELVTAIREHKAEILQILREDAEFRRTDIIQSERQVLDLAREFFGTHESREESA